MEQNPSLIDKLRFLSDITLAVFKFIFMNYNEKVELSNVKVEPKDFDIWYGQLYEDEDAPSARYDFCSKRITIFAPPTPVHQRVVGTMVEWLQKVAYQLSDSQNEYSQCTLYETLLDYDDKKIPGVVLSKGGEHYLLVAVGVGFAEPLDKLLHDAERIMQGSWGRTALVIIVKMSESKQHTKDESPWGLASDHATLRELYLDRELAPTIGACYDKKNLNIVGDLGAKVLCTRLQEKRGLGYLSTSTIANLSKPPPISHQLSQLMGGRLVCPSNTFTRRFEREKQTGILGAFIV